MVIKTFALSCLLASGQTDVELQTVLRQGLGSVEGRAAWDKLSRRGPETLLPLLEAMNGRDTSTANWLRLAFDRIADREWAKGGKGLDRQQLLAFVKDAKNAGRARRLALEIVEKLEPGTSHRLHAGWREDPEFRFEGVAIALEEGRIALKQKKRSEAQEKFHIAFQSSRDVQQAREAAAGLMDLGESVSVARHLGFLLDWQLAGPFGAKGQKGFQLSYPPEKGVDLLADLAGQGGRKLRWKRYRVREPAPTSGGRHQALVNLAEKDALGDADDAVAFAYTEFAVVQGGEVEFRGAADDNFTVWVNGAKAFGFEEYRNGVRHDRHRFKVTLRSGKNVLLVKICQTPAPNPEPNWEFFLRVVDASGKGIDLKNLLE